MNIVSRLTYDPSGIWQSGMASVDQLAAKQGDLESARDETVSDVAVMGQQPPANQAAAGRGLLRDAGTDSEDYAKRRDASELGHMLAVAERLREQVDRVVVLGIGGSYMGARTLMEACREPYFNELSRAERGTRPRMVFEGNNVDNDAVQGLLHLLRSERSQPAPLGRWALVVISKSGGTLETAAAFPDFPPGARRGGRQGLASPIW